VSAPIPHPPGTDIAPGYRVLGHLHQSRAFDVYDAWSEERGCRCVVKTLRRDRRDDERTARRLVREGRLLARLSHPHIVRGYEVLRAPEPMVVTETIGGETLGYLVQERVRPLAPADVAQLGLHLCSAVGYLHRRGYLHLDLKPANVVAEAGRAKVIDLSLARRPGRMAAGVGTWCYLAPEQARGGLIGPAADVWGIGLVLHETATGKVVYDDDDDLGSDETPYYPQLEQAPPALASARLVPAVLARAIDACLHPDPAKRPTVAELEAALAQVDGVDPPPVLAEATAQLSARG
jgi:eukaryotic-like serine/threonine-protein kinase